MIAMIIAIINKGLCYSSFFGSFLTNYIDHVLIDNGYKGEIYDNHENDSDNDGKKYLNICC